VPRGGYWPRPPVVVSKRLLTSTLCAACDSPIELITCGRCSAERGRNISPEYRPSAMFCSNALCPNAQRPLDGSDVHLAADAEAQRGLTFP